MKHTEVFNRWYSEKMGHPLGVQLGKNAVEELEKENDKSKGQLKSLFERVSGCEVSDFDDEQVDYLADMIEGQMDADEGSISKLKKQNAELREMLKINKKAFLNQIELDLIRDSAKDEAREIAESINRLLNK